MKSIKVRAWSPMGKMLTRPPLTWKTGADGDPVLVCEGYNAEGDLIHLDLMLASPHLDREGTTIFDRDILSMGDNLYNVFVTDNGRGKGKFVVQRQDDSLNLDLDGTFAKMSTVVGNALR